MADIPLNPQPLIEKVAESADATAAVLMLVSLGLALFVWYLIRRNDRLADKVFDVVQNNTAVIAKFEGAINALINKKN